MAPSDSRRPREPALGRVARLRRVLERDPPDCVWCRRPLHAEHPHVTTEHVVPRLKGGPPWLENEVAACHACNTRRRHASPVDWLEDCERRGLHPDAERIAQSLDRLDAAIATRGGQRRARPYLDGQRRRLRRRERDAA